MKHFIAVGLIVTVGTNFNDVLRICAKNNVLYSSPSIIRTSLIQTLDYPNYQINDIHSICGVHQIEVTSPPIENIITTS